VTTRTSPRTWLLSLSGVCVAAGVLFVAAPPLVAGGGPTAPKQADAAESVRRGEQIFLKGAGGSPPCLICHKADSGDKTVTVGPNLGGIGTRAGSTVDGLTARDYLEQSILHPAEHLVSGYQNLMFAGYAKVLSDADVNDLIAYLLATK